MKRKWKVAIATIDDAEEIANGFEREGFQVAFMLPTAGGNIMIAGVWFPPVMMAMPMPTMGGQA